MLACITAATFEHGFRLVHAYGSARDELLTYFKQQHYRHSSGHQGYALRLEDAHGQLWGGLLIGETNSPSARRALCSDLAHPVLVIRRCHVADDVLFAPCESQIVRAAMRYLTDLAWREPSKQRRAVGPKPATIWASYCEEDATDLRTGLGLLGSFLRAAGFFYCGSMAPGRTVVLEPNDHGWAANTTRKGKRTLTTESLPVGAQLVPTGAGHIWAAITVPRGIQGAATAWKAGWSAFRKRVYAQHWLHAHTNTTIIPWGAPRQVRLCCPHQPQMVQTLMVVALDDEDARSNWSYFTRLERNAERRNCAAQIGEHVTICSHCAHAYADHPIKERLQSATLTAALLRRDAAPAWPRIYHQQQLVLEHEVDGERTGGRAFRPLDRVS